MPLNSAVYEPGRNKIFAVSGGYVHRYNSDGFREASSRFAVPDWGDTYICYSAVDDKLYTANSLSYGGWNPPDYLSNLFLFRINPDTLAVEHQWAQDEDLDTFDIRQIFSINDNLYLVSFSDTSTFIVAPADIPTAGYIPNSIRAPNGGYGGLTTDGTRVFHCSNGTTPISTFLISDNSRSSDIAGVSGYPTFGIAFSDRAQSVYCATSSAQIVKSPIYGCLAALIDLDVADATPFNIRTNPYNSYIYVPLWKANKVAIIDPRDDTFQIISGFDSPFDVVFTPTRTFAIQHGPRGLREVAGATLTTIPPYVPPEIPDPAPTRLVAYYSHEEATGFRADATGRGNTLSTLRFVSVTSAANSVVTRTFGPSFDTGWTGTVNINGVNYTILSVTNGNTLTLTTNAGVHTNPSYFTKAGDATSGVNTATGINGQASRVNINSTGLLSSNFDYNLDLNNGFTVCFWYRPLTTGGFGFMGPLRLSAQSGCPWEISISGSGGSLNFYVSDGVSGFHSVSKSFTANTWYFIRFWIDPSDLLPRVQVNNGTVTAFTVPLVKTVSAAPSALLIYRGSSDTFDIDETAIYEGALTDAEAAVLYGSGTPPAFPAVPYGPISPSGIASAEAFGDATVTV